MRYVLGSSRIHGTGAFASEPIPEGEGVAVAITNQTLWGLLGGGRTPIGENVNHSPNPNTKLVATPTRGEYRLVATQSIVAGAEITMDYDDTPWFIGGTRAHRWVGIPLKG